MRSARRWRSSEGWGSFTFTTSWADQASSPSTSSAPTALSSPSSMADPSPAPRSTTTRWPWVTSSRTPSGVRATRFSPALVSAGTPTITCRPARSGERLPGQAQPDDGLGVHDVAAPHQPGYLVPPHPHHGHVSFLDAVGAPGAGVEVQGQVDEGVLVAEPGRVEELGQLLEPAGAHAHLLLQLPAGRELGLLADHVALARRYLEQLTVDGGAVLAHEQHGLPLLHDRHHRDRPGVVHHVAFEAVAVGRGERGSRHRDQRAAVALRLRELAEPAQRRAGGATCPRPGPRPRPPAPGTGGGGGRDGS